MTPMCSVIEGRRVCSPCGEVSGIFPRVYVGPGAAADDFVDMDHVVVHKVVAHRAV